MDKSLEQQLIKAGYTIKTIKDLLEALPKGIFVPDDEKNAIHLKRIKTVFMLRIDDNGYTFFWMVKDDSKEPPIIQKTVDKNVFNVIGKMLLFTKSCNAF